MIELARKNIFALVFTLILLISIPFTVGFLKNQQDVRSRASEQKISLSLSPLTATKTIGDEFDITVSGQTNGAVVKGIDFQIQIDTTVFTFVSFIPTTNLNDVLINSFDPVLGILRFTSVDTTQNSLPQGTLFLGTLRLKAKATGAGSIVFPPQQLQIVALRNESNLATYNNAIGTYTVETKPEAPRTVGFAFSPPSGTQSINTPFDVTLTLNAGRNFISGLDVTVKYNKDVLTLLQFQPGNTFSVPLLNVIDANTGTFRFAAVDPQNTRTDAITLGVLRFTGKTIGASTITLENIQVAGLGASTLLVPNTIPAIYTIK